MSIRYINVAVFVIWSVTCHNSRYINIENETSPFTAGWQKNKFTSVYQTEQFWWELYNRECGENLTDMKSESTDIEKA